MIIIILSVLLAFSLAANVISGIVIKRLSLRLLQFDDLFLLLTEDIDTNLRFFKKLRDTPLVSDADEVQAAHKNMMIMGQRLDEYVKRMEELAGRSLHQAQKEADSRPRPVVV
jgi:hypothetical protein